MNGLIILRGYLIFLFGLHFLVISCKLISRFSRQVSLTQICRQFMVFENLFFKNDNCHYLVFPTCPFKNVEGYSILDKDNVSWTWLFYSCWHDFIFSFTLEFLDHLISRNMTLKQGFSCFLYHDNFGVFSHSFLDCV